jgi:hypothetical protein
MLEEWYAGGLDLRLGLGCGAKMMRVQSNHHRNDTVMYESKTRVGGCLDAPDTSFCPYVGFLLDPGAGDSREVVCEVFV